MKTIRHLSMVALGLLMGACTTDDITTEQPAENGKGIPFTATLSNGGSATRALSGPDDSNVITATWAMNEHVALVYKVGDETKVTDAEVTAVSDGTDGKTKGTATISATLDAGVTNGTDVTLIYPFSAVNQTEGDDYGKIKTDVFEGQTGELTPRTTPDDTSISEKYDLRIGTGKISLATTPASLKENVTMDSQIAIWKLTFKYGETDITNQITNLTIVHGSASYVVTPTAQDAIYVAMYGDAEGYEIPHDLYIIASTATNPTYLYTKSKASVKLAAGKMYTTTGLAMDRQSIDVGYYLNKDGSITFTKQTSGDDESYAVIAYVGSADKYFSHFLAIALNNLDDHGGTYRWSDALTAVGTYAAAHPVTFCGTTYNTSTTYTYFDCVTSDQSATSATHTANTRQGWRLPTVTDWRYIFDGLCGGAGDNSPTSPAGVSDNMEYGDGSTLRDAINTACGNTELIGGTYWSSSQETGNANRAWGYGFGNGMFMLKYKTIYYFARAVFAY